MASLTTSPPRRYPSSSYSGVQPWRSHHQWWTGACGQRGGEAWGGGGGHHHRAGTQVTQVAQGGAGQDDIEDPQRVPAGHGAGREDPRVGRGGGRAHPLLPLLRLTEPVQQYHRGGEDKTKQSDNNFIRARTQPLWTRATADRRRLCRLLPTPSTSARSGVQPSFHRNCTFFSLTFDESGHLTSWSGDPVLLDKNVVEDAKVRIPEDNYSSGNQPILLSDCLCTSLVALHNIWNSELELFQGGGGLYLPQYVIIIFIYPHKVAEELRSWRTELDKIGDQWTYSWIFKFLSHRDWVKGQGIKSVFWIWDSILWSYT